MPLGSRHGETGLIALEHRRLVLRRDGGGRWRLDGTVRLHDALGRRARVEGVRSEFDLLDVERFELI